MTDKLDCVRFQISSSHILASYSGRVTQEIIEKLIRHLQLHKDDFPTTDETDPRRIEDKP